MRHIIFLSQLAISSWPAMTTLAVHALAPAMPACHEKPGAALPYRAAFGKNNWCPPIL